MCYCSRIFAVMLTITDYSLVYFNTSPGVQSSASQIPARVEKRIALILLFLIFDRLTFDMPTFSASSFSDICRSAIMTSSFKMIFPIFAPQLKAARRSRFAAVRHMRKPATDKAAQPQRRSRRWKPRIPRRHGRRPVL